MAQITQEGRYWSVSGPMDIQQVELMLAEKLVFKAGEEIEVDLSKVTDVDTATISLLFEWLRQARSKKCNMRYANLPANLTSLARLYDVLELIPLSFSNTVFTDTASR